VVKKFPAILKKVEAFPAKCDNIKNNIGPDLESLDFMAKAKAGVAMA